MTTWERDGGAAGERADPDQHEALAREHRRRQDDEQTLERREVEWATTSWHALVAGSMSREVSLTTVTGAEVTGTVTDVGDGWCQLDVPARTAVVLLDRVIALRADARVSPRPMVQRRIGSVLRRWARRREPISVELVSGELVTGQLSEVLTDALTLVIAIGPDGVRSSNQRVTIPFDGVVSVRGPRISPEL